MASPEKMVILSLFALLVLTIVQANAQGDIGQVLDVMSDYNNEYAEKQQEAKEQEGWIARRLSTITVSLNEFWDGVKISGQFMDLLTKGMLALPFTQGMTSNFGEKIIIWGMDLLKISFGILLTLNAYLIYINKKT